jgi:hypothetical protein
MKNILGRVRFDRANVRTLNSENNITYAFMRLHNACNNNPIRDKSRRGLYFLVSEQIEGKKAAISTDELLDALLIVREYSVTELKAFATASGKNTDRPIDKIKQDLNDFAKAHSRKIIENSGNAVAKTKLVVYEPLNRKIILLDQINNIYFISATNEQIIQFPLDADGFEVLVEHLTGKKVKYPWLLSRRNCISNWRSRHRPGDGTLLGSTASNASDGALININ